MVNVILLTIGAIITCISIIMIFFGIYLKMTHRPQKTIDELVKEIKELEEQHKYPKEDKSEMHERINKRIANLEISLSSEVENNFPQ